MVKVLDHGYVMLLNVSGPTRRSNRLYDADDVDPAQTARISFDDQDTSRAREDDLKLYEYLIKNRHTTPIEMIEIWLEMKMPIFVARQFVRHRTVSINEVSARYTKLGNHFYVPEVQNVGVKSKSNKQGRTIDPTNRNLCTAHSYRALLNKHSREAYTAYEDSIEAGVPNELARCFLPVNFYTWWVWKQDLHNMMNVLRLRLDSHAQYETRMYAKAIYNLLNEVLPKSMEYFDKYVRM